MKTLYKVLIPIFLLTGILVGFQKTEETDIEKDKVLIGLIRHALKQAHYDPIEMDNEFSKNVFDDFINTLDPYKRFFLQKDLDEFMVYKYLIDDQIKSEDLTFYNMVYTKFRKRVLESEVYYTTILKKPFNFDKKRSFNLEYDKKPFSKNRSDMMRIWSYQLKVSVLSRLYDKYEAQEAQLKEEYIVENGEIVEEVYPASENDFKPKPFDVLEKEAREETHKNLDDLFVLMSELDETVLFPEFINSITQQFDPHTTYFAPKEKKRFDISMAGKLEGIGARLQKKGDYTRVSELISGGPAWRAGELEVGDLILKVAQGDSLPVNIVGMRLDNAIEYIKGKKGTTVKLTLKKIDGSIKVISIVRDIVELEETFAKSSVVNLDNRTFGLINLPKFYIDFNEKNFRNSATDMEQEVLRLKNDEHVEGLVIDLRNNGGGSLKTAIEIAGLFIQSGPIVQVKYRGEAANVKSDINNKIQWDGPLVILVNELSASASEIFAAAMQDYNRAIIVGSKQTFGKGTVQNILPLNNYFRYDKDLGALKMTIQKFYRINGGSTQLKGVESDIAIPDRYSYLNIGERDEKNPLAWDQIEPVDYTPIASYENFQEVINNSKTRIATNPHFMLIDKHAKWLKEGNEDRDINLNFEEYKTDVENRLAESKKFERISKYQNSLVFKSPTYELPLIEKDSLLAKKREIWHKNLSKDIYVEEALTVLSELRVSKNLLVKN